MDRCAGQRPRPPPRPPSLKAQMHADWQRRGWVWQAGKSRQDQNKHSKCTGQATDKGPDSTALEESEVEHSTDRQKFGKQQGGLKLVDSNTAAQRERDKKVAWAVARKVLELKQ